MNNPAEFKHPYDTPLSGGLRFLSEVLGWVACAQLAASYSPWLALPALLVVMGLPAVFSTPGDKKKIFVATPGPLRVLLELALFALFIFCFWAVWPAWLAAAATAVVIASIAAGIPRIRWLLQKAPGTAD